MYASTMTEKYEIDDDQISEVFDILSEGGPKFSFDQY